MKTKNNKKTREDIADPNRNIPYDQKLEMSGSINLIDNHTIKDLGNGYIQVIPIDPEKKFMAERPDGPITDITVQDYHPKDQGDSYQVHFEVTKSDVVCWNEKSGIIIPKESFIEFVNSIIAQQKDI